MQLKIATLHTKIVTTYSNIMMNKTDNELKETPTKSSFRIRGIDTTRLQTFMDAAFAFAMTMLVISIGEIPKVIQN